MGPDYHRRKSIANVLPDVSGSTIRELPEYPDLKFLLAELADCEVVIVDLDPDVERALRLIEEICSFHIPITVMARSTSGQPELLMRCMRAGAREFLIDPVSSSVLREAFARASVRRQMTGKKKLRGHVSAFFGAKGGSGVTTIASNFALALARESEGKVVLVDIDLQIGDAALVLGCHSQFSVIDALINADRLDSDFLGSLLARHGSGLFIMAGPEEYAPTPFPPNAGDKLFRVLKEDFDYIVVDAGSNLTNIHESLLNIADNIYLVAQVNIPTLRRANRLISHFSKAEANHKLEIILNRYSSHAVEIGDDRIAKALTQPVNWKIPNQYQTVQDAQNAGVPLATEEDSPVSRVLFRMARAACGKPVDPPRKRKFGLFS